MCTLHRACANAGECLITGHLKRRGKLVQATGARGSIRDFGPAQAHVKPASTSKAAAPSSTSIPPWVSRRSPCLGQSGPVLAVSLGASAHEASAPALCALSGGKGWRLVGPPAHTSRRTHANLRRLRGLVPPRIRAAVLSTVFNRWTTDRRMRALRGQQRTCLLGCPGAADAVEHYLQCPVLRCWMATRLGIRGLPFSMERWMFALPLTDRQLRLTAVSVYVMYRLVNHLRHNSNNDRDYQMRFMNQLLHEAVRDNGSLRCCCGGMPSTSGRRRRQD